MFYNYGLVEIVTPKINKKKVFFVILIVVLIIALSIFGAIKYSQNVHNKKEEELKEIENQKIIEEAKRIQEEQERERLKRLKNSEPFTEQQMQSIENIYNSENKRVFLTFDDGPTKTVTPGLLDLLKQENIKVTFFVLGNRAKANPELIQREFNEGHYIANHGYSHKYSQIYQNEQNVLDEYNYTEQCIQEALQNPDYHSKVFRYPGGSNGGYYHKIKAASKELLRQNGIVYLDWNSLSKDAEGAKTKEDLVQNVIETVGEKTSVVILMHDSSDKILTYESLPDVINYLRANGYEFKTLYDIL